MMHLNDTQAICIVLHSNTIQNYLIFLCVYINCFKVPSIINIINFPQNMQNDFVFVTIDEYLDQF